MADEKSTETGTEEEAAEGGAQQKPEDDAAEEGVVDKHGHPGISEGKYERDIKERDERIAELEAQIAKAAETEAGRKELQEQIEALKAESADKELAYKLELAGCLDEKAAKARIGDFDGDVAKLKEGCPYLFEQKEQKGSMGLKPGGAPKLTREQIRKIKDADKRRKAIADNLDMYE